MSLSNQIIQEATTSLDFTFRNLKNLTNPGQHIKVNDTISFELWIKNKHNLITFEKGWCLLYSSAATEFHPQSFEIDKLMPREERKILTQEALIIWNPDNCPITWFGNDIPLDYIARAAFIGDALYRVEIDLEKNLERHIAD